MFSRVAQDDAAYGASYVIFDIVTFDAIEEHED